MQKVSKLQITMIVAHFISDQAKHGIWMSTSIKYFDEVWFQSSIQKKLKKKSKTLGMLTQNTHKMFYFICFKLQIVN